MLARVNDEERERIEYELESPLPWEDNPKQVTAATVEQEMEGFAAFAGMIGSTPA